MRIAIDFDGTIANTNVLHPAFCKAQFGIDLPIEATVSPLREQFLTREQIALIRQHVYEETLRAPLVQGVREALQQLVAEGHRIVILTARTEKGVQPAKDYLRMQRIPYHHFLYVSESEKRTLVDGRVLSKKIVLEELKFDVMIEDQVKGLKGLPDQILAILLTRPWNRNEQVPDGIVRMNGWGAIVKFLLAPVAV